jgi:hypothetical protein
MEAKFVKFRVLEIVDSRKTGSTIEVGKVFKGLYNPKTNTVNFTDVNEQDWIFYVNDTCEIVEEVEQVQMF